MALFKAEHIAASYSRKGETVPVFSDVCFELAEGKIYDLVGPSGGGKSTLLRVLALMLDKTHGSLYLKGRESSRFAPTEWRRQVCLVPQVSALVSGTVKDNLMVPWKLKIHKGEAVPEDDMLSRFLEKAELHGIELDRDVSQLSGGQRARVALLRAFIAKPSVLLLDEVDAALDDELAEAIGRLTNALVGKGQTCLRIRHRVSDGFASATFTLRKGVLTVTENSGSVDEVFPSGVGGEGDGL